MRSKLVKGVSLLRHPRFISAFLRHRVAGAVEHLPAIRLCAANTLIDAGANKGQFSLAFRSVRPNARIVAFEPLDQAADTYEAVVGRGEFIRLERVALGADERTATFHVANREDSSSLLKPGVAQERAFGVHDTRSIEVPVRRLSDCVDIAGLPSPILLKVDVQGGELGVFEGCDALAEVDYIYVELSFVELYEGQPLFDEVAGYLRNRGFRIAGTFNQVSTPDYGPTQVDVLFRRDDPAAQ